MGKYLVFVFALFITLEGLADVKGRKLLSNFVFDGGLRQIYEDAGVDVANHCLQLVEWGNGKRELQFSSVTCPETYLGLVPQSEVKFALVPTDDHIPVWSSNTVYAFQGTAVATAAAQGLMSLCSGELSDSCTPVISEDGKLLSIVLH